MKRRLYVVALLAIISFAFMYQSDSSINKQAKKYTNPFDTLTYDKVIAYDYNGSPEMQIVIKGEVLPIKSRIFKQTELTKQQVSKFHKIIGTPKSYGGSTAACFDPHFGIVYFNQNKIVGHISVCLACNYLMSSATISAQNSHTTDLCETCYAYGFSKRGRKNISALVKELQFSHWQLNSELFDK